MQEKKITINDIAKASGYSKTAVSFAFNEPSRISAKALETILQTANDLEYVPDPLARNLSLRRHKTIGLLLPQSCNESFLNPYITQIVHGVGAVCEDHGYTLMLIPPHHNSLEEAVSRAPVDGIITLGLQVEMQISETIRKRKLPHVTIDGKLDSEISNVFVDNKKAAYTLMRYILDQGHRSIGIVPLASYYQEEDAFEGINQLRIQGYRAAFTETVTTAGEGFFRIFSAARLLNEGGAIAELVELLPKEKRPTCLVFMSDIAAIGCMKALQKRGIQIPEDVSIAGFDGILEGGYCTPILTTISQPGKLKGERAAELLFDVILEAEKATQRILIPFEIIKGESVLCLNRG